MSNHNGLVFGGTLCFATVSLLVTVIGIYIMYRFLAIVQATNRSHNSV